MTIFKSTALNFISVVLLTSTVFVEDSAAEGIKLGFGFDRDFGVVAQFHGDVNGFIGNKGAAIDFLFVKDKLKMEAPARWYVGAGGYGDWDGDVGVRLPIGAELNFTKNMDAFAQMIPRLRINNNTDFGLDFAIGARYQF